jgi:hypothetical protein
MLPLTLLRRCPGMPGHTGFGLDFRNVRVPRIRRTFKQQLLPPNEVANTSICTLKILQPGNQTSDSGVFSKTR